MRARWICAALSLFVVSACMGAPTTATAPATSAAVDAETPRPTPNGSAGLPSATPSKTPPGSTPAEPTDDPLAGVWRVRKVLSPGDRSALLPDIPFQEQAFVVTPGCASEPCPSVEVRVTPFGRARPETVTVLERVDGRYVSAAQAENEGPCLNDDGDRVQGGATATSTLRVWAATTRAEGTAVERASMVGSLTLDLIPTPVGSAAGCKPQSASYELTGRRIGYAVRNGPPPEIDLPPNTAGGLTDLPSISVEVSGVEIDYFAIDGDTVRELDESLANGGVMACGAINYEWHEGDARPAACAITSFGDIEAAIERRGPGTACTITDANVRGRYTIHMPRWTAPERVPRRLLAWWRDVVDFIRDHEVEHVRISRAHVKELNADLQGAGCDNAASIIRRWAKGLNEAQAEFDRAEYQLPWPQPPFGY